MYLLYLLENRKILCLHMKVFYVYLKKKLVYNPKVGTHEVM